MYYPSLQFKYLANATCRVLMIRLFSSPKLPHSQISWYWRTQMSICGVSYPILHENRKPRRYYDDVITWKHFPRYWPFVWGIHQPPVNSPHQGQWRGALMFSLIFAWMNGWVNNRDASDSRRHRAHYDVTVMILHWISFNWGWVVSVNYATIGSNDGLSSVRYQAIIWIGPLIINFNEIWSEIICIYVHSFFCGSPEKRMCIPTTVLTDSLLDGCGIRTQDYITTIARSWLADLRLYSLGRLKCYKNCTRHWRAIVQPATCMFKVCLHIHICRFDFDALVQGNAYINPQRNR